MKQPPRPMSELALELIQKCNETRTPYLDIGKCGLTSKDFAAGGILDVALRKCSDHLETLVLSNEWYEWGNKEKKESSNTGPDNFLDTHPPALSELTKLTTLYGGGSVFNLWGMSSHNFLFALPRIKSLNFSFSRLSSEDAEHIAKLTNLIDLDISYNHLHYDGAQYISRLSNLTTLNIGRNQLKDKGAKAIATLSNLTHLNISENQLTDQGVEAIAKLSNLTHLNISGNQLTDKSAEDIAKLFNITYLDVSLNELTDKGAKAIAGLSNITHLNISGNGLTEKGTEAIAGLSKLAHLEISSNKFTQKGAEAIAGLSNLTFLDISLNGLTKKGAEAIAGLSNLTHLDIQSNQLTDKGAEAIATLSNLINLNISENQLTDKGAEAIATLSHLTHLYYSGNGLADKGAEAIAKLANLTHLNISLNVLTEKGAEAIAGLSKLTHLDIRSNQLTDKGADAIAKLANLIQLDIRSNHLTEKGAKAIVILKNLTYLDICDNQLKDKGAQVISKLVNLTYLDIGLNGLTEKGAEAIAKLVNLTYLNIQSNQLTKINCLKTFVENLEKLSYIYFDADKIEGWPKEIGTNINALRAFFRSKYKVPNRLVKMILIGNTTAGKSSLADYLVNKKYNEQRESTHGIQLWRWKIGKSENALQVNIWDFGGQDYYHATHNLFLEDKTIFLFLHTDKSTHISNAEEKQYLPQNYWLGNIRNTTNAESSVWYIQSKSENSSLHYLDSTLQRRYNVSHQYKISVKQVSEGVESAKIAFDYFLNNLENELGLFSQNKLPASWIEIRDTFLPKWREEDLYLNKAAFKKKCEQALKDHTALSQDLSTTWDGLMPYLKGSGEIVYFNNAAALGDLVFLSAEKLTNGIYNILSQKVLENKGEFTLNDLKSGDSEHAEIYLEVLFAFKIIFEKHGATGVYVAPQYLPENPYTIHFQQLIKISYVIHFPDYMSRSIITNFLVEYAGLEKDNFYWRYGSFFKKYELNAFVRIDSDLQKVYVHLEDGNGKSKFKIMKELFLFFTIPEKLRLIDTASVTTLKDGSFELGIVKRENRNIEDVPGEIELSVNDNDFVSVADLREAMKFNTFKIRSKQGGYVEFNAVLRQLLNTNSTMPKKIFLSYSHKDDEFKKELDMHFAALKRSGKVETWQDRKILPGEDWDKSIEEALYNADIALLLLSPDFMASDYIWNVEIPKAIEKGVIIIPIFLRPCDFNESVFEIFKKQGLPGDTDWIVGNKYRCRDEAYLKVINGIKVLLEK